MRLHLGMEAEEWGEILNSLHKVARGEEDISMDLNIATKDSGTVLIYVRNNRNLQVLHEIDGSGPAIVDINEPTYLVFDSQVLRSVVQKAGKRDIDLKFGHHEFEVEIGQETFSSSTRFNLRLVQDTEFQEPLDISGYEKIGEVDRVGLLENLRMFTSVSKVVNFSADSDGFTISVSDKVQGSGELKVNEDSAPLEIEATYPIRPLKDFLQKMKSDQVTIYMNPGKSVKIQSETDSRVSSIHRSHRLS